MDSLTPEERTAQMAKVRSQDTQPEMLVRCLVFKMGYRYRLHRRSLPGKPDLVFSSRRKAIFIHGCFWHGHNCRLGDRLPKTRIEFWTNEISTNRARDETNLMKLTEMGWEVLVIWECQLKESLVLEQKIIAFLDNA